MTEPEELRKETKREAWLNALKIVYIVALGVGGTLFFGLMCTQSGYNTGWVPPFFREMHDRDRAKVLRRQGEDEKRLAESRYEKERKSSTPER